MVILDTMQSVGAGGTLVIDTDHESTGDGTLTVHAGKELTTGNHMLLVTTYDLDLPGAFNSGTNSTVIHGASESQSFGLGDTSKDMHVTDAELGRISTSDRVVVGSSTTGNIVVDGITEGNSNSAAVRLVATKEDTVVTFLGASATFNRGIIIQAMGGIVLSESARWKALVFLIFSHVRSYMYVQPGAPHSGRECK